MFCAIANFLFHCSVVSVHTRHLATVNVRWPWHIIEMGDSVAPPFVDSLAVLTDATEAVPAMTDLSASQFQHTANECLVDRAHVSNDGRPVWPALNTVMPALAQRSAMLSGPQQFEKKSAPSDNYLLYPEHASGPLAAQNYANRPNNADVPIERPLLLPANTCIGTFMDPHAQHSKQGK